MTNQIAANNVAQHVYVLPPIDMPGIKIDRASDPIAHLAEPHNAIQDGRIPPVTGINHVYFLPTVDRTRLKIGRSTDPVVRIAGLARVYPEIDLASSVIVAVDSHQIETALHTIFGQRREILPIRSDGYTEWFRGDFLDEALALLETIAAHRGVQYRVIRNVEALLADYLAQNPSAGERNPRLSAAERASRAEEAKVLMREAAIEHARSLCDKIVEANFDSVVRCCGQTYLARTVSRVDAPECWDPTTGHYGSTWGKRFARESMANIEIDGSHCLFHMLNPPVFGAIDEDVGREYFMIYQDRPLTDRDGKYDLFSPAAFGELWNLLDQLPVIDLPGEWPELPESGLKGQH